MQSAAFEHPVYIERHPTHYSALADSLLNMSWELYRTGEFVKIISSLTRSELIKIFETESGAKLKVRMQKYALGYVNVLGMLQRHVSENYEQKSDLEVQSELATLSRQQFWVTNTLIPLLRSQAAA